MRVPDGAGAHAGLGGAAQAQAGLISTKKKLKGLWRRMAAVAAPTQHRLLCQLPILGMSGQLQVL